MLEYLKQRFLEENPNVSKIFEQTYQYKYLNLYYQNYKKQISKQKYLDTINEMKFVVYTLKKSVQNYSRKFKKIELDYNLLKENKEFIKNERENMLNYFWYINSIIKNEFNYLYNMDYVDFNKILKPNKNYNPELKTDYITQNLKYKKIGVCRDLSLIYLAIFELLNFPLDKISLATAPEHVFIRYQCLNGIHINWETTAPENGEFLDDDYCDGNVSEDLRINKNSLNKTSYLKQLNDNEILATLYVNFAGNCMEIYNDKKTYLTYLNKAYKLDKTNCLILNNYGAYFLKIKKIEKAEKYYQKSFELNSYNFKTLGSYINFLNLKYPNLKNKNKKNETSKLILELLRLMIKIESEKNKSNIKLIKELEKITIIFQKEKKKNELESV